MRRTLAAAAGAMLLAGCGGSQAPPVDAAKALREGGAALGQVHSLSATLNVTKGAISLQGFSLVKARTALRLPHDSDTVYSVKEQDILISFEVIMASGHVYLHLPLSNFQEVSGPEAAAFPDLAKLMDPTTGLPALIPQGAHPRYVSTEQVGGVTADRIATAYTAEQVHALLPQLTSSGPVAAAIWVDRSDHLIRRAVLDGDFGDGGKEAVIEVDMADFNAAVTIGSPTP